MDDFIFWEHNYSLDDRKDRIKKINRVEFINHAENKYDKGRLVTVYKSKDFENLEFSIQDDGETLKIFIS